MDIERLIADLSRPEAYPHPVGEIEPIQTHISLVFLAGPFVYKIKKPVDLGFLDFSALEKRWHFCGEEVRLNRRLASGVYLDVVPVTLAAGRARFGGTGEPVEWAVKMTRLPEGRTYSALARRGELTVADIDLLATRLAAFHAGATADEATARWGRWEVVAGNCRENFSQTQSVIGLSVSATAHARLSELTERELAARRGVIESRASRGVPRDTHGDLHLDHVYSFPEEPPPHDLVIVDCIEFNERFRFADPIADAAFLRMDLQYHGRPDLADRLVDAYVAASGDAEGRELFPLYTAYRAVVRGKVEGFKLGEREVPEAEREASLRRARSHFLLALTELAAPRERPCLLLVGGLPGSGKSRLSAALAGRMGLTRISSDETRKALAGVGPLERAGAAFGEGIYTAEWNERVYAECLRRAEAALFDGGRVVIDASFATEGQRRRFLDAALGWGVPGALILCEADEASTRRRLDTRVDNPSDADWAIYLAARDRWEGLSEATRGVTRIVATTGRAEETVAKAEAFLGERGLA